MNCRELIAELSNFPPGKPVRLLLREVAFADEVGDGTMTLNEDDAGEADTVRPGGAYVLIEAP